MEEEVVAKIVLPHVDLVTLIRVRPWADFEPALTIIAILTTNNAEQDASHATWSQVLHSHVRLTHNAIKEV